MTKSKLEIAQLAFNTLDLPGSLRLFSELYGYVNAGANGLWGGITRIHRLPDDSRGILWWMVNDKPFFQLEFFNFSKPRTEPLADDWRASDLGWNRFGLSVPDFDLVVSGLKRWGIETLSPIATRAGVRRLAYRDPFAGIITEVIEGDPSIGTRLAYVAYSVEDLEASRRLHQQVFGAEIEELTVLHEPSDEAMWGLGGITRDGFLARYDDCRLEIVRYDVPPRGRPAGDAGLSNQGIPNVALCSHDVELISALIERLLREGHVNTHLVTTPSLAATYFIDPGCQFELLGAEEELEAPLGFVASTPFFADTGV